MLIHKLRVVFFTVDAIAIIECRTISKNFRRANPLLTIVILGSAFLMKLKPCTDNLIVLPFYLVHMSVHIISSIRLFRNISVQDKEFYHEPASTRKKSKAFPFMSS